MVSDRILTMAEYATLAMAAKAREYKARGIAVISLSLGEPERALDEFEGALRHDPENPEVLQAVQQIRRELRRKRS